MQGRAKPRTKAAARTKPGPSTLVAAARKLHSLLLQYLTAGEEGCLSERHEVTGVGVGRKPPVTLPPPVADAKVAEWVGAGTAGLGRGTG